MDSQSREFMYTITWNFRYLHSVPDDKLTLGQQQNRRSNKPAIESVSYFNFPFYPFPDGTTNQKVVVKNVYCPQLHRKMVETTRFIAIIASNCPSMYRHVASYHKIVTGYNDLLYFKTLSCRKVYMLRRKKISGGPCVRVRFFLLPLSATKWLNDTKLLLLKVLMTIIYSKRKKRHLVPPLKVGNFSAWHLPILK